MHWNVHLLDLQQLDRWLNGCAGFDTVFFTGGGGGGGGGVVAGGLMYQENTVP